MRESLRGFRALRRALIIALLSLISVSATAADLAGGYSTRECFVSGQSDILDLPRDELEATLNEYRDEANMLALDPPVVASNSAAFDWAVSASLQCTIALGYLAGGNVDEASSQKCDCFHARMLSTL